MYFKTPCVLCTFCTLREEYRTQCTMYDILLTLTLWRNKIESKH